jgi:branched-subunit amino acid aminotransferase/4-amino-4-deoxychorismate lyase
MSFINYNGRLYPDTEILFGTNNRAFRFGEGLIETMLWQKEQIRFFNDHIKRLSVSLETLYWPALPRTAHQLGKEIEQLIKSNMPQDILMIRLQVFRLTKDEHIHFLIECIELDQEIVNWKEKGLHIGISKNVVKTADRIANLKTTSRLNYSMAAAEAEKEGWDDILITGPSGFIVESAISNLFWIANDTVYTPPLSSGCIAGIMRKKLLQSGSLAGLSVEEKEADPASVKDAAEIFLSNAIRGVQPVTTFNGKTYPSLITRNVFNQFEAL